MVNRSRDWFLQAEHDIEQAEASRTAGRHDWACFAAHQAAEKAVKALHLDLSQEAWGRGAARLLSDLPAGVSVPPDLIDRARVLDNFSIPTRYPDSHPEGAPSQHYGPLQSQEAMRHAGAILAFVRAALAGP
jgi:HEPN domain-containing protein